MKQHEIDAQAASWATKVKRFTLVLWLGFLPVLGLFMYLYFDSHQPPAHVVRPPVFSCASENASLAVIGAGGAIAPLCGQTPDPSVPGDGG